MDEVRVERKSIDNAEEEPNGEHPVEESKDKVSSKGTQVADSSEIVIEHKVKSEIVQNEVLKPQVSVELDDSSLQEGC